MNCIFFYNSSKVYSQAPSSFLTGWIIMVFRLASVSLYETMQFLPLPMKKYTLNYLNKLSSDDRRLIIYDQLNPNHAKYYSRQEAIDLLKRNGFYDIKIHHRHGDIAGPF